MEAASTADSDEHETPRSPTHTASLAPGALQCSWRAEVYSSRRQAKLPRVPSKALTHVPARAGCPSGKTCTAFSVVGGKHKSE